MAVPESAASTSSSNPPGAWTRARIMVRAARVHHWLKNILVFSPTILAHSIASASILLHSAVAFLSFSLCASAGYLFNDVLDLDADRVHPTKRNRPLAAGDLSLGTTKALIAIFLLSSVALALLLPPDFLWFLALYLATTMAYSWRLKRSAIVDVLMLAGLYTMRILAGGAATETPISFWLLAFSMFLFLSLGLVKRYTELLNLISEGGTRPPGRGYAAVDLETLAQFGSASAYMAVLVLALYINSESVRVLYSNPEALWFLCPLLLYLTSRLWLLARRGQVHEDPLVFILVDSRSYILAAFAVLFLWLAI